MAKVRILLSIFTVCLTIQYAFPSVIHMTQEEERQWTSSSNDVLKEFEHEEPSSGLKFSLAKVFQDNMVLQRAPRQARVFGFSPFIGAKVIAQMSTPTKLYHYSTNVVAGPKTGVGYWVFTLDVVSTSKPVNFTFASEGGTLTLSNVLFGDVWLCSGQSNMQFTVSQSFEGAQEAMDAENYPNIRLLQLTQIQSTIPFYDVERLDVNWSLPSSAIFNSQAWSTFSAVCWMYGKHIHQKLGYPIGLVATNWGGTPVEAWSSPDALKKCGVTENISEKTINLQSLKFGGPQGNSVLWNSMIHPLLGMTIYGSIWYQGESDSEQPIMRNRYNCTFPTMISDWRAKFNSASINHTSSSFPFGFVQLAPNRKNKSLTTGFPDIRWHQTADVGYVPNNLMPNTFMAVAIDLPDFKSPYTGIHPRNKEDVGYRLSLGGLSVAYNMNERFQGPFPTKGGYYSPAKIVLDYGTQWTLNIKSLHGFEVKCQPSGSSSYLWYPIQITTVQSNTLTFDLSSVCGASVPVAMRYAWLESPCGFKSCAVYATLNDLPAPPFYAPFSASDNGQIELMFK